MGVIQVVDLFKKKTNNILHTKSFIIHAKDSKFGTPTKGVSEGMKIRLKV